MRNEAQEIITYALSNVLPDRAVTVALSNREIGPGRIILIAIGKASWQMAHAAEQVLHERINTGIVITKYSHAKGPISNFEIFEAGHPISDDNSYAATREVIRTVSGLSQDDTVLFLVSGGGSALFEIPAISANEHTCLTEQLLACGAAIDEINTIRKRLSLVKGGRFGQICSPAQVFSIVLSDIIGDPLDMIASGPACPDHSSYEDAIRVLEKYNIKISEAVDLCLKKETPKVLPNVATVVTGSVKELCRAAASKCSMLGYETFILTDSLCCEAKEAGSVLASIARFHQSTKHSVAFIAGGETIVHLNGKGKGGRNQELVLSAADGIAGLNDTCIFSVGSDGTDGPTDAAGGYCTGETKTRLSNNGISIAHVLRDNDSYNALNSCGGLIKTGPTGTNVNDFSVLLIKR